MGVRQVVYSDVTGEDLDPDEAVTVVERTSGLQFDTSMDELQSLDWIKNVVRLELHAEKGDATSVLVTKSSFDAFTKATGVLDRARPLRRTKKRKEAK